MFDKAFVRFSLKLGAYFVLGHLLSLLPPIQDRFVEPWTVLNARWGARLASVTGESYVAEGSRVQAGTGSVDVRLGCNGVDALVLCASAILAFPASWKSKALGVLMAVVSIFGLNLIRLANLFFVARRFPQYLELFHIYIWQVLIGALALAVFLLWGRFFANGIEDSTVPAPR